jgi:hypothetical protein
MSHGHQRKERNCLNCGAFVQGRYCQACGQENIEPKESFWFMVRHFFEDITHFDGKFFKTLKDLLFRPGFLSAEYIKGRRMSYLHPIRMYVFTSAVFFLIFFNISGNINLDPRMPDNTRLNASQRDSINLEIEEELKSNPGDPNLQMQLKILADTSRPVLLSDLLPYTEGFTAISTIGKKYNNRLQYDSAQQVLPVRERDGWFVKLWNKRAYELNDKYKYNGKEAMQGMISSFLHKLPYLLFVSLPFFALILKLLYIRRKNFYYAEHGVFSIHHYIFSFILLLLTTAWSELMDLTGWAIWNLLIFLSIVTWFVYLFLAMRRFYGQSRLKTFFKFFLLNIIGLVLAMVLGAIFFLLSIFQQ